MGHARTPLFALAAPTAQTLPERMMVFKNTFGWPLHSISWMMGPQTMGPNNGGGGLGCSKERLGAPFTQVDGTDDEAWVESLWA